MPKGAGTHETNDGLPRKPSGGPGTERSGFEGTDRQEFCKGDCGVSSQEFAVGEFLVEVWARSCFQQWQELHPASEDRCTAADGGEEWGL